jgi:hypothetical protein
MRGRVIEVLCLHVLKVARVCEERGNALAAEDTERFGAPLSSFDETNFRAERERKVVVFIWLMAAESIGSS